MKGVSVSEEEKYKRCLGLRAQPSQCIFRSCSLPSGSHTAQDPVARPATATTPAVALPDPHTIATQARETHEQRIGQMKTYC
jgi:hypothetical protein